MVQAIASWFNFFSAIWSSSQAAWAINVLACGTITVEAFTLLHMSEKRVDRLAFGIVCFGAFAYFVGELSGEYQVVAGVESVLHVGLALALAIMMARKQVDAPSH